jgi:hypothetical protein
MSGLLRPSRYVAVAGFLLALACHVATYVPFNPGLFQPLIFGSFPLMFPLVLIVILAQNQRRIRIDDLIKHLTTRERLGIGAFLAYVAVDFVLMIRRLPGQPEIHDGAFFMNVHEALTRISQADYVAALQHANRLYSGHEMAFYGLVAGMVTLVLRHDVAMST